MDAPEILIITFIDDNGNTHEWPILSTSVACISTVLERIGFHVQDIRKKKR